MSFEALLPAEPRAVHLEPNGRIAGVTVHQRVPGPVRAGFSMKAGRDQLPAVRDLAFGPDNPAGLPTPWATNLHRVTLSAPHGRFLRALSQTTDHREEMFLRFAKYPKWP
jgi:hypothetical protein